MINSTIIKISTKEASEILEVALPRIQQAVQRGTLSKLPTYGYKLDLIKEQVLLFKGKSQIRTSMLSPIELEHWMYYKNIADKTVEENKKQPDNYDEITKAFEDVVNKFVNMSDDEKTFTTTALIILAIIVILLGINWYVNNINEVNEKLSNISLDKVIDSDVSESIIKELQQLGDNIDPDTIIETVLKKVS